MATAKLSASPVFDFSEVSYDKASEIHLDVMLIAPEKTDSKRIPLHLILAIDCSGSMDGNKLGSVKNTTCKLIDHLTENDTLGVLGFSEDVWDVFNVLPMTKENKEMAKTEVKKLHTRGSTNLSQAIIMSMERAVIADKSKTCRIILLTDGCPTCGECNKEKLVELSNKMNPSVSMSTFGYGSDFDIELMTSISSAGRGASFYIKADEDCNKAFAMELGGLLSLFGQNIKMTITPSGNMEFKELLSDYKCEQKTGYRLITGSKFEIQIDDIFAGEKKHVILKLAIPEATEAVCARATHVCNIDVAYTDIVTKNIETLSLHGSIQYVKPDKAQKDPNEEVQKQLLILEVAKIQKEAQEKADQGDLAGARNTLNNGIQFVTDNAKGLSGFSGLAGSMGYIISNYSDDHQYRSVGRKMSESMAYTMSTGRSSSADTLGVLGEAGLHGYQSEMLKSFTSTGSGPIGINTSGSSVTVSDVANLLGSESIIPIAKNSDVTVLSDTAGDNAVKV